MLVWQDLSRTSASGDTSVRRWNPRPKDCDLKVFIDNMTDFIARARRHSCILLWCGSKEAPAQDDLNMALQDEVMPALDDSRICILTSSTQPAGAKTPINTYSGGPWSMQRLPQYYPLYDSNP